MNQTTQYHTPIPYHLPSAVDPRDKLHHIEVAGMQVELRYKQNAPSLQQKVIQLCNQSLLH